ncbi:MAG: 4Fe-4S cluster-binding domain-containing protein [Desulfovibrio sp.]|uniref:4Fe-4S single cluster domain-containing protein n=1 Tax=Desulfovibrio sp. TaxID=885 RepID=UPI001A6F599F|nr:4Fe-4S single cluster domain-containing protein [Desulfovibrio sp.]MBD5416357.1 4Fe-4S cluster-binding domain-containing protein [Desulfovibrio sp.]
MPEAVRPAPGAWPTVFRPPVARGDVAPRLRLAGIVEDSIVDGPGLRLTIFTQGCPHGCPGCHNPETHPVNGGSFHSLDELVVRYRENPLLSGVTFSGGEPFLQASPLALLAARIHALGGTVITYTGYIFEELAARARKDAAVAALLDATDLLIDGPYIEALRSLDIAWRGSSNQRLLDRELRARLLCLASPAPQPH